MKPMLTMTFAVLMSIVFTATAAAQRMDAKIDCAPTGEAYVHHCVIHLMEMPAGDPVEDASFVVRADMPSMPMAHNVPPATAVPGDGAGVYEATLELDMHGTWALRLDIESPRRDIVVVVRDFLDDDHAHGHDHEQGHSHDMQH